MSATPEILVEYNFDCDRFEIMARSHNRTMPFGPRIFRAPPHPDVQAQHDTMEAAEADARKVRAYLAALPAEKRRSVKFQA